MRGDADDNVRIRKEEDPISKLACPCLRQGTEASSRRYDSESSPGLSEAKNLGFFLQQKNS